jgi:enoyl-CoA hydratase
MAMPEAAIGFFPDVGGSYFLPRLPANAGWWMGLTGARVHGAHAVQLGLATHLVNRDRIPALANALESSEAGSIEAVLSLHAHEAHDAAFGFQVAARERWFEPDSLAAIETRLQADDTDDARSLLDAMRAGSPHSRRVMFDLMQQGATLPLSEALRIEHRTAREIIEHPDFIEGVRAVLVDKDRDARWVAP